MESSASSVTESNGTELGVGTTYGNRGDESGRGDFTGTGPTDDAIGGELRLGHEIRFVLAAVGGGAIRIGQSIARQHIRHLETIAINCDPHVQDAEEYDRRICLGPESGGEPDTGGSPMVGGILARAAQPALDRIFEHATFVTVIGTLGGGAGTGALPSVLESAAHGSEVLSVFVVKPFACEGERRSIADRALGRLHFVAPFVEKQQRGRATLQVLDNDTLVRRRPKLPFNQVNAHWADLVADHIEKAFLGPVETALAAAQGVQTVESSPAEILAARVASAPEGPRPLAPPPLGPPLPALHAGFGGSDAELTFEVVGTPRAPELL